MSKIKKFKVMLVACLSFVAFVANAQTASQLHSSIYTVMSVYSSSVTNYGADVHSDLTALRFASDLLTLNDSERDFYLTQVTRSCLAPSLQRDCLYIYAQFNGTGVEAALLTLSANNSEEIGYIATDYLLSKGHDVNDVMSYILTRGWYDLLVKYHINNADDIIYNEYKKRNEYYQYLAAIEYDNLRGTSYEFTAASVLLALTTPPSGISANEFDMIRCNAVHSLWRRGSTNDVGDLGKVLKSATPVLRNYALLALGTLFRQGKVSKAGTELEGGLSSSYPEIVYGCEYWLNPIPAGYIR